MPRPEEVSRDHIDAAVMGFLKGEKEADWTEVSLVTLHPREEIRLVLKERAERYRSVHERRFQATSRLQQEDELRGSIRALERVLGKTPESMKVEDSSRDLVLDVLEARGFHTAR